MIIKLRGKPVVFFFVSFILPLISASLELIQNNSINYLNIFLIWIAAILLLFLSRQINYSIYDDIRFRISNTTLSINLIGVLLVILFLIRQSTITAGFALITIFLLTYSTLRYLIMGNPIIPSVIFEILALGTASITPIVLNELIEGFPSEEFSLVLQGVLLGLIWIGYRISVEFIGIPNQGKSSEAILIKSMPVNLSLLVIIPLFVLIVANQYQHSFFPESAPETPGISDDNPFICFESDEPVSEEYDSRLVLSKLLQNLETKPNKNTIDYGMLAAYNPDYRWLSGFRTELLKEAHQNRFTQSANSVKYDQFLASKRVYYYARLIRKQPDLFTPSEQLLIEDWFTNINNRAMTTEWVDYLYAFSFQTEPLGPYHNQSTGAGLLSLLEYFRLGSPEQYDDNNAYLITKPDEWDIRFRVTDDAAIYQGEWISNSWFESLYSRNMNERNAALSFEWIKLLAPPDGSPLKFNHVGELDIASFAYFGAALFHDQELLWIAKRAVDYHHSNGNHIQPLPGIERDPEITGIQPDELSCLLYGNSGLPTQSGPLAPDKVVLRDGWNSDSTYLLLNLRYTGWHRYKATNTIISLINSGKLLTENQTGDTPSWFPAGRSQYRDKRIPRENLNGLVIPKQGMSKILFILTSFGSKWAQNPPYYAQIEHFQKSDETTMVATRMGPWNKWDHQRKIYLYNNGPLIIFDSVSHPADQTGEIRWHTTSLVSLADTTQGIKSKLVPVLIPSEDVQNIHFEDTSSNIANLIKYNINEGENDFLAATVFLFDDWLDSAILETETEIIINNGEDEIKIPIP